MGDIVLLDDLTINKIAAGEVIERPASAVKEMVENSIDAGATKITVEIKNGGISFIRISDNGKGVKKDDMEIAFERHATSKIRSANDILKVKSMGFRGEALASIASISHVEMVSRTEASSVGNRIVIEGGKIIDQSEIGAPIGTTITVHNLFYNTPVRYKFLKKDYTESGYIEDAITRLALVNKNIAFKLINTGKTIIQTNGDGDERNLIYSIYGKDIAGSVINTNFELDGYKVTGVVGKPEIARSNRSNQLFFVNGRYVKDRTLTAAAEQAFRDVIPANKYGFLILNIEMNPALLDVNVHPAKLEVRFEDDNKVFNAVYSAIKDSLSRKDLLDSVYGDDSKKALSDAIDNVIDKADIVIESLKQEKANADTGETSEFNGNNNVDSNKVVQFAPVNNDDRVMDEADKLREVIEADLDNDREKSKFSLFKKKKHDDFEDEDRGNLLEEVYKFRQGLKEIGVSEVSTQGDVYSPLADLERLDREESETMVVPTVEEEVIEEPAKVNEVDVNDTVIDVAESVVQEEVIETPSEDKVQEMTEELIKQRNVNEALRTSNFVEFENTVEHAENDVNTEVGEEYVIGEPVADEADVEIVNVADKVEDENKGDVNISEVTEGLEKIEKVDAAEVADKIEDDESVNINVESQNENINISDEPEKNIVDFDNMYEKVFGNKVISGVTPSDASVLSPETLKAIQEIREHVKGESLPVLDEQEEEKTEQEEVVAEDVTEEIESVENRVNNENSNYRLFDDEEDDSIKEDSLQQFEEFRRVTGKNFKYIGNVFADYAIVEIENDMYIINQNYASERLVFDELKRSYISDLNKDTQPMLLPDLILLNEKQMDVVRENYEIIENSGFGFEAFGENTLKLNNVPSICMDLNTKQLFIGLLDELVAWGNIDKHEKIDRVLGYIADKTSNNDKVTFSRTESEQLLEKLLKLSDPFAPLNGKNIAIKMAKYDIERKFARK